MGKSDPVDFLGKIWKLPLLASEDPKYKDAYGDAVQHLRNNTDWDDEYTFLTRFGLLNADEDTFCKFLNAAGKGFAKTGDDYGLPVCEVDEKKPEGEEWPRDIKRNLIPLFVDTQPTSFFLA